MSWKNGGNEVERANIDPPGVLLAKGANKLTLDGT